MVRLHLGDCRELLADLENASVDAVVCDPPYGLGKPPPIEDVLRSWLAGDVVEVSGGGFMGREWDAFIPGPDIWREVFRVLKPGGHAVVFAGQRTVDVMGIALRLGGFEVRDLIGWQYWSGFPKSLDVSKAIDRVDGREMTNEAALRCTAWLRSTGITARQVNEATGTFMASHYLTAKSQPAIPTLEHLEALRPLLPAVPAWFEELARARSIGSQNMKRREVVTRSTNSHSGSHTGDGSAYGFGAAFDVTKAHTPEAKRWEGWGTALKPCIEPALLVRKPLDGTVAGTVLAHGTGALNVDECRYAVGDPAWPGPQDAPMKHGGARGLGYGSTSEDLGYAPRGPSGVGRWPANVYACPKPSTKERERGCEGLPVASAGDLVGRVEGSAGMENPRAGAGRTSSGRRNIHPTVKPVRLLRWMVRLVTPPHGVVLDPFAGSGSCGVAAVLEGFDYLGAEMEEEYHRIAAARVKHAESKPEAWLDTRPGPPVTKAEEARVRAEAAGQVGLFGDVLK